ncbi:MAG: hypothetical protein FWF57_00230 [Defluviitaleaceae bacterium]|nr:hypothetical protein [Defluviitaleaceae bacterium]
MNISKNGKSVIYADFNSISDTINYDFEENGIYLTKFFENLFLVKNNILDRKDMIR